MLGSSSFETHCTMSLPLACNKCSAMMPQCIDSWKTR